MTVYETKYDVSSHRIAATHIPADSYLLTEIISGSSLPKAFLNLTVFASLDGTNDNSKDVEHGLCNLCVQLIGKNQEK